jgi:UDP-N-acetylmuramate--alanine ligase
VTSVRPRGMATGLTIAPAAGTRAAGSGPVTIEVAVPGLHNALNAAAAFALAAELGYPAGPIAAGLAAYGGARRRMELKGEADGVRVVDSYAHHPTELAADLAAARDVAAGGRVIALFQPHLFSRTRIFASDFGAALGQADEVLVLDIYAAREDPEPGVTGQLVASAVPGGLAQFLPDRSAAPAAVAGLAKPGDLVLTMGAGDVTALGPLILAALRERAGEPG